MEKNIEKRIELDISDATHVMEERILDVQKKYNLAITKEINDIVSEHNDLVKSLKKSHIPFYEDFKTKKEKYFNVGNIASFKFGINDSKTLVTFCIVNEIGFFLNCDQIFGLGSAKFVPEPHKNLYGVVAIKSNNGEMIPLPAKFTLMEKRAYYSLSKHNTHGCHSYECVAENGKYFTVKEFIQILNKTIYMIYSKVAQNKQREAYQIQNEKQNDIKRTLQNAKMLVNAQLYQNKPIQKLNNSHANNDIANIMIFIVLILTSCGILYLA